MNLIFKIIPCCFLMILISSCESHEKKADDAFDQFKEEKKLIHDTEILTTEIKPDIKNEVTIKKNESTDDWTKLKNEIDKRIKINEYSIKHIKNSSTTDSKILKKLTRLEDENNALKKQIDEYIIDMKLKLEQFKTKIDKDTQELEVELKELTALNKK